MEPKFGADEQQMLDRTVASVAKASGTGFAFGGFSNRGVLRLTSLVGNRTRTLGGLVVQPERGLGGQAMAEGRARIVSNYAKSRLITHDYDSAVVGEGVVGLFAVPFVIQGRACGIIYSASHRDLPPGSGFTGPVAELVASLSRELSTRNEAAIRIRDLSERAKATHPMSAADREELRESYAELRAIAASVDDAGLKSRLHILERRLAAVTRQGGTESQVQLTRLSPRELDVLAHVALGRSNSEVGDALGVREVTVKGYLAAAMAKLGAPNRYSAVAIARRLGLIA